MQAPAARFEMGLRPTHAVVERRWHDGATPRTGAPVAPEEMAAYSAAMAAIRQDALDTHEHHRALARWQPQGLSSSTVNTLRAKAVQDNVVHAFMAWRAISGSGDPTQINPLDPLYFASHLDGMMTVLSHSIEGGVGTLTRRAVSVNRAEVILGDAAAEVTDMVDYIALRRSSGRLMQGRHLIV